MSKKYYEFLKNHKQKFGSTHGQALRAYQETKKNKNSNNPLQSSVSPLQSSVNPLQAEVNLLKELLQARYTQPIYLKCDYPEIKQQLLQPYQPEAPNINIYPQQGNIPYAPSAPSAPHVPYAPPQPSPLQIEGTIKKLTEEEKQEKLLKRIEEEKKKEEARIYQLHLVALKDATINRKLKPIPIKQSITGEGYKKSKLVRFKKIKVNR